MIDYKNIFDTTMKCGGITYNIRENQALTKGFVVALYGYELQIDLKDFTIETIKQYIKDNERAFKIYKEAVLGTWVNDDKVFLDISKVYNSKEYALTIAKNQGELAIFNLDNFEEITIEYDSEADRLSRREPNVAA